MIVVIGYLIPIGTHVPAAGYFAMFMVSGGKIPGRKIQGWLDNDASLHLQHPRPHLGLKQYRARSQAKRCSPLSPFDCEHIWSCCWAGISSEFCTTVR